VEIIGPASEALSNEQIMARYGKEIGEVIAAAADPQYDYERQVLINQARLNWQFVKGNHFNVPGMITTPFGQIADYISFDGASGQEESGADIRLCPPLNVIGGDCYKFMAVMGENAPKVKGVADDLDDPESVAAGHDADVNIRDLWTKNHLDRKWKIPAFHQYTTGPCFIRGIWNADARKYGQSMEPKIDVVPAPDGSPMPQVNGEIPYPNGDAEARFYSVLEVSVPFDATELDDSWLRFEIMLSKWQLLARYKSDKTDAQGRAIQSPLEKYRDSDVPDDDFSGSSASAQEAREAVVSPTGAGRSRKPGFWRFNEYWLPPNLFEAITDSTARGVFQSQFQRGLYVARVGSITVEIDDRMTTDEWSVCRVGRSDKIMERPLCADGVPIQRALNDLGGMALETILRSITKVIFDTQLLDRKALSTSEAIPNEWIPTALPVDGDISKRVWAQPPARLSDQAIPLFTGLRALIQDITGIRPEIAGGGETTETYREARQRRDQALMQLSPQAKEMRAAAEDIAEIMVRLRAKFGAGTVKVQSQGAYGVETEASDIAQLQESGWHAESDDNFPMTLADRRDAAWSMLKEFPPEVKQAMSVLDPINSDRLCELVQLFGFDSAIADQKNKTVEDIRRLLNEKVIEGPDGQSSPSIPTDPFDNHQVVADIMAKWLVSNYKVRNENPAGYENVVARQAAEAQLAAPPPPPTTPPMHGAVNWSGKLEDFPNLVPKVLEAAGVSDAGNAPSPQPEPAPADLSSPAPVEAERQTNPLPPLPGGPAGPQPETETIQ
jgi:hypothetical protein